MSPKGHVIDGFPSCICMDCSFGDAASVLLNCASFFAHRTRCSDSCGFSHNLILPCCPMSQLVHPVLSTAAISCSPGYPVVSRTAKSCNIPCVIAVISIHWSLQHKASRSTPTPTGERRGAYLAGTMMRLQTQATSPTLPSRLRRAAPAPTRLSAKLQEMKGTLVPTVNG